jgi:hypothetical protein
VRLLSGTPIFLLTKDADLLLGVSIRRLQNSKQEVVENGSLLQAELQLKPLGPVVLLFILTESTDIAALSPEHELSLFRIPQEGLADTLMPAQIARTKCPPKVAGAQALDRVIPQQNLLQLELALADRFQQLV